MRQNKFRMLIMNAVNGKVVDEKLLTFDYLPHPAIRDIVMEHAREMVSWFDTKDTFFSGKKMWDVWNNTGSLYKFERVIAGKSTCESESVIVFPDDGGLGQEHFFALERL